MSSTHHVFDAYVIDVLMRDLVGHDRRPASFLVYLWLAAEQAKRGSPVRISYQELAESVGISKSSAQSAAAWLLQRKLLAATRRTATETPTYRTLEPWNDRVRIPTAIAPSGKHDTQSLRR